MFRDIFLRSLHDAADSRIQVTPINGDNSPPTFHVQRTFKIGNGKPPAISEYRCGLITLQRLQRSWYAEGFRQKIRERID